MFEAARLADPIAHTSALAGFLIGAAIGIALIAVTACVFFSCGFLAGAVYGLLAYFGAKGILALGEMIGKMFSSQCGSITLGSPNVFINGRAAAFAIASTAICSKHNPVPLVAEGSPSVFINGLHAARKNDTLICGARIDAGSPDTFIGGGTEALLKVAGEIPEEWREHVETAFMLAGLVGGLAGLVIKAGTGLTRALLPCAARYIAGFALGEAVGRYVIGPVVGRVMGGQYGHPVDVTTGRKLLLAEDEIDFTVASPIPVVCARFYASNLTHESTLGKGWVLPWDLRLQRRDSQLWLTDAQGRETGFPAVPPGHAVFSEAEQCYLACTHDGRHILYDLNETFHDFGYLAPDSGEVAWVQRIEDRSAQWHRYTRNAEGHVQAIETSGGQRLGLYYEGPPGRLTGIECTEGGEPGLLVRYRYDHYGQLASVTDANGAVARRFTYTGGLMTSHVDALGFTCNYQWAEIDGLPRVVVCATSEGEHARFRYDTAARQTWAEDELGRTAHWVCDTHFQVVECTDLDGSNYRVGYTEAGYPERLQLPGGRAVVFAYDQAGRIIEETDPLGRVTHTRYDGNSLRVSQLMLPDGSRWRAEYDFIGRLTHTTDPLGRVERYEYPDGLSPLPLAHIDARGGRQAMTWNRRGLLTSYVDCSGKATRYEYDGDGHLAASIDALGRTTRYRRLRTGEPVQVTLPDGSKEEFEYDAAGLLIVQRSGADQARQWVRNARGQVTDAVDPAKRHLRYRYDKQGRLVDLASDASTRYRFTYDLADRLAVEYRPDGIERHLGYDAAGQLETIETVGVADARGDPVQRPRRTTRFESDAMGRLLTRQTATATTSYAWDAADRLLQASGAPSGQGAAAGIGASTVRFEYDAAGRLLAEHGAEGTVRYELDELDNVSSLSLPHGQQLDTLTYGSGHVHQIRSGERLISDFERDDLHREVQRTQGRLTQRTGYDLLGRRSWQAAGAGPEALGPGVGRLWRSYRYDHAGELAEQRDSLRGSTAFRYDPAGHLLRQARNAEYAEERFAWDAAGNLLDEIGRKSRGQVEGNRLKVWQDLRFEYDAWGNLSTKRKGAHQTQCFSYDADDRLIKVTTENQHGQSETCFEYDPLGRRIGVTATRATASGRGRSERKRFVWQGLRMVQEVRETGVSSYVYSPEAAYTPLARLDAVIGEALASTAIDAAKRSARLYHFHTDLVGAPLEVTDEAGEVAWTGEYAAWGKVERNDDDTLVARIDQPLRYPGQYADDSTGLHYNTFRYYDPDIGRFISQDPIGLAGGVNLYAYAPNPLTWSDPLGWINAPAGLPNTPGIYTISIGNESYIGSAGIGKQGMNGRVSTNGHKVAQEMLKKNPEVHFQEVDLGTATSKRDRNRILRHFEQQQMDSQSRDDKTLKNQRRAEKISKYQRGKALVANHGASIKPAKIC